MARLRCPRLKVLYISGFIDLEMVLQDEDPRLGELLSKPITPSELKREVEDALAARHDE
jgi:DNA-binding NtrC family response regulator